MKIVSAFPVFLLFLTEFSCHSKIKATLTAGRKTVLSSPATSLKWVETSPQNQLNVSAQWTKSLASKLANQKIQFFSDSACGTTSGDAINLNSFSTTSYAFVGAYGNSYTYKITSVDDAGSEGTSSCSDPMIINAKQETTPTISAIASQATDLNTPSSAINFVISDSGTSMSCNGSFLSLKSSNTSIVSTSNVVWGGTYPNCTAVVTPIELARGVVNLTITVTNSFGNSASSIFSFEVYRSYVLSQKSTKSNDFMVRLVNDPQAAIVAGGKLIVAENAKYRISVWNSFPSSNQVPADYAIGQPDLYTVTSSSGGVSASSLSGSVTDLYSDGTRLYAADYGNHRVLIWNSIPTTFDKPADVVIGQPDFTSSTANNGGLSSRSLNFPRYVSGCGTKILISDLSNKRVLVWNTPPTTNYQPADLVIGQSLFTTNAASLTSTGLAGPRGVACANGKLFVVDGGYNRVLGWNSFPTSNGQAADFVLGQSDFVTSTSNAGGMSGSSFSSPAGIAINGNTLYVTDLNNSRILVWTSLPTTTAQSANFALGSTDLVSVGSASISISQAWNITTDGTRVLVPMTKFFGNIMLVWNTPPTSFAQAPDMVFGSDSMTYKTSPESFRNLSSNQMSICGTKLFAVDSSNHRVLAWNSIPDRSDIKPDFVLGQPSISEGIPNNGGISGGTMYIPRGVYCDGTRLFVVDYVNHRVLVWNQLPTVTGQSADLVLGQANFTTSTSGTTASTLFSPTGVFSDGSKVYVSEQQNHRVMIWNTIPSVSGQAANVVLGQPNFTSNTPNNGGISASSLASPGSIGVYGGKLIV
ncbi:MAG: hypothetical protein NT027_10440 [Proteobacteria bacterium]|nr:hypothetical protein [Pseudomonadota bacterium]